MKRYSTTFNLILHQIMMFRKLIFVNIELFRMTKQWQKK